MRPDLEIDTPAVRRCASGLADTGARVAAGAARAPVTVTVPRWAASDAAATLVDAAHGLLVGIGSTVTAAGRRITAAADDYDAADDRAAGRLGSAGSGAGR